MTIKDIAKECGCAVGTVSRVLNDHPDVSVRTREKVRKVVDKYGFELNTNARLLKAQESKTIVVLLKGTASALLSSLLEKVQKRIEVLKYSIRVVILDEYDNEVRRAARLCYEQKAVGVIFLGGTPEKYEEDFKQIKIPCVLISSQVVGTNCKNLSSVSIDNFEASRFSAEYLLKNGHRKIGAIGGSLDESILSKIRYDGFLRALNDAGIEFDFSKNYVAAKYSFEGGAKAAAELLEKVPDVTAVYTMSDVMAVGACRQFASMQKKVPDDISVTGFDGIRLAEYYCPRLTTIRQSQDELVESGLDILLTAIEKQAKPIHKIIPFEFIQGESVKNIGQK